ncbi:MAG TPA: hypothetical protein VFK41_03150 [Nocardioidaceae bacterium]|nr:hypothetical protein [Nocardioidaceae bacterium]
MKEINLVGFNGAWHLPKPHRRRIIANAAALGAIVAGVECKWLEVDEELDPTEWIVLQDLRTDAAAGCVLALRCDRVTQVENVAWHVGTTNKMRGFPAARMETRHILAAEVQIDGDEWLTVLVAHFPPKRYAWLYTRMLRQLRRRMSQAKHPVVVFADWNRYAAAVAVGTGLLTRVREVVGWAISPGMDAAPARRKHVGGDHPAVVVTLRSLRRH